MRRQGARKKVLSLLVVMALSAPVATDVLATDNKVHITNVQEIAAGTEIKFDGNNGYDVGIKSEGANAHAQIMGKVTVHSDVNGSEPQGITVQADGKLTGKEVAITMKPKDAIQSAIPKGLIARDGATVELERLDADVTLVSANPAANGSPDSNASYGVAVGYNSGDTNPAKKTNVTIQDGNIHVSNSENTIIGTQTVKKKVWFFDVTANVNIGHQLSGIRVYRLNGSEPTFTSNGNLNVSVTDNSTAKAGDYLVGVYVNGEKSKAIFNGNTSITVTANGENSAGIKIGKPFDTGLTEGASVIANGKLVIDTEATKDSGAVRLFDKHSVFKITGDNTEEASYIKSGKEAIVFDTKDYKTTADASSIKGTPGRNAENSDNEVYLKNTVLSTTGEESPLILARGQNDSDFVVATAETAFPSLMKGRFNTGSFAVKNAQFTLTGEKSNAVAAPKGWLIQVDGKNKAASELTVTIDDHAYVEGLVNKDADSKLHMHVNNGAIWKLATKAAGTDTEVSTTATASDITIGADGKLDASTTPAAGNHYILNLSSPKEGEPKGLLQNAGTITLANQSYDDVLELQGNYVGNNGKLLMNLNWTSPGDDVEGTDSQGDRFFITGTATGTTNVVPVTQDGKKEAVIDGNIGSIANDLQKNTLVVIRVDTKDGSAENAFTGTAKTKGAGELQLVHRDTDKGREYYWTLTALSKEQGPPIYNDVVPGYTLLPRVLTDMAIESMSTLHERRGENQVVTWDGFLQREEKSQQIWARYLGSARTVAGTRLGYDLNANGIQIGKDFSIRQDPERPGNYHLVGGYLTIMHGSAHYQDAYRTKDGQAAADLHTGTSKTNFYALGLTSTSYKASGAYVDYVGQIEWGDNSYQNAETGNLQQNSWGLGLSVETGKAKLVSKNERREMYLEPQAQLIYHYGHLSSFNDGVRAVDQGGYSQLTGRIGARLTYERMKEGQKSHYRQGYLVANLWHHFTGSPQVRIGDDVVESRLGRTVAEIGIGGQYYMGKDTYLYGDLRYMHGLGSGTEHGYRGTIGIKYTW